jgi:hypothetical protein
MAENEQSSFLQTLPRQASHASRRTGLRSYKLRPGRQLMAVDDPASLKLCRTVSSWGHTQWIRYENDGWRC